MTAGRHALSQGPVYAAWAIASNEMCTFLIINISSLQLIPVMLSPNRSQSQRKPGCHRRSRDISYNSKYWRRGTVL